MSILLQLKPHKSVIKYISTFSNLNSENSNCKDCCRVIQGFLYAIVDDIGWYDSDGFDGPSPTIAVLSKFSYDVEITSGQISNECLPVAKDAISALFGGSSSSLMQLVQAQAQQWVDNCISQTVTLSNGDTLRVPCNLQVYLDPYLNKYINNPNYQKPPQILEFVPFAVEICFHTCSNLCTVMSINSL